MEPTVRAGEHRRLQQELRIHCATIVRIGSAGGLRGEEIAALIEQGATYDHVHAAIEAREQPTAKPLHQHAAEIEATLFKRPSTKVQSKPLFDARAIPSRFDIAS